MVITYYFCIMVTEEEKKFIEYWEANRLKRKKILFQLMIGLPAGLLFGLPILLTVIFNDWYKNLQFITPSQVIVVIVAVLGIAVFYGLFKMKYSWETNEQLYKELKFKSEKQEEIFDGV